MITLSTEDRSALAAYWWPQAWALAQASGVKFRRKRAKLRREAEVAYNTALLKEEGHSCANCCHFNRFDTCNFHSEHDFWGDYVAHVEPQDCCCAWSTL